MRRPLALASLLCLASTPAAAGEGLDVSAWLARPGVRLLAVEFYATWCAPCMKAVPRWKALHERYQKDGLRLVVVSTRDVDGSCTNPGWNPDDIVCDDEGFLADRFGANQLPAAFLWTWQGDLLVKAGHVEEVSERIHGWMPRATRVDIEIGKVAQAAAVQATELADLVRDELRKDDKLVVVATAEERRRLDELRKRSFKSRYDEAMQCEVGKELSANGLVRAKISGRSRPRLHLQLLSAERGCLVASSVVGWSKHKPAVSVAEGVRELVQSLQKEVEMPWATHGGQVRRADQGGDSPYAAMAAELANAERDKRARAQKLERAWSVVSRFAGSPSIAKPRRIEALEQFLKDFPQDNPRAPEAHKMLASLRPPPPPPPTRGPVVREPEPEEEVEVAPSPPRPRARGGDLDGDGILDHDDACPAVAEDRDGFQDEDGCPEADNDGDGFSDAVDKCPAEPETINGYEDEDGCPDTKPAPSKRVVVTSQRIEITEKIFFATGSARILERSYGLLDEVAAVLRAHPDLKVEVQGHTDSRGSAAANQKLSQRRASSVAMYLVAKRVKATQLSIKGYGEDYPIASNDTKDGREKNRRIEFKVK